MSKDTQITLANLAFACALLYGLLWLVNALAEGHYAAMAELRACHDRGGALVRTARYGYRCMSRFKDEE